MRRNSFQRMVLACCLLLPAALSAQVIPSVGGVKPTPEQAQTLLQTRPDLVAQLRQRLVASGMTAEQIRARLREEGYPENMLDGYLPGATGEAKAPTSTVFRAVQDLGITDTSEVELLGRRESDSASVIGSVTSELIARSISPFRLDTMRPGPARDAVMRLITNRDSGYAVFGLDLFRGSTSQFLTNGTGPVSPNYRLGPGDRLVLILTGDVEASYSLDVTREGFVVVPQVGQIDVNNLTMAQLDQVMFTRLSRVYSGISRNGGKTHFSVSVSRLRSNQVFVVGEVQRPGSYTISSAGTALTALYAAAGPSINGSMRRVDVRRDGRVVDVLDVYDYLLRGDASHDVSLQSGDIVFVPVSGARARVVGEIVRPATYELKPGEGLPQLLEAVGGFTASASRRRVYIERIVASSLRPEPGSERTSIDVTSTALASGLGPQIPILNGDVVRVFAIADRVRNRIGITGNVNTPGSQGLAPGMMVGDALKAAGGIKPDTYLGEVLIARLGRDSTRTQLRVSLRDSTGAVLNDIPLQEDDQIRVFSLTDFRPVRYVAIAGHVNHSGRFIYREGMTVRDLVLLAHGLKEGAMLNQAEIARLPADRTGGKTAVTIRIRLDSTYLFERRDGRYLGPPGVGSPATGAPEVLLEPYDNVLILRQPNFEFQRSVTINGEVQFPGAYALASRRERLRDLIARAGGLTEEAHAVGIVFVRKGPTTYRATSAGVAGDVFTVAEQDTITRARVTNGRIGIDLPDVLHNAQSLDNIVLEDGDEITIPRYNPVVRVQGAVNAAANVTFVPGRDVYYYINAAGGGSRIADMDRAYVTQPSGKLESVRTRLFAPDIVPVPQAGSVITVPENDPSDKRDIGQIAANLVQVLASLVAIVALVRR